MKVQLHQSPETPFVIPEYRGGPWDGGFGAIEPTSGVMGTIRLSGGRYSLQGFSTPATFVADTLSQITPDYAVYQWEAG